MYYCILPLPDLLVSHRCLSVVFTEKYCTANRIVKLPGPRDWVQILQDQIKLARRRLKRGRWTPSLSSSLIAFAICLGTFCYWLWCTGLCVTEQRRRLQTVTRSTGHVHIKQVQSLRKKAWRNPEHTVEKSNVEAGSVHTLTHTHISTHTYWKEFFKFIPDQHLGKNPLIVIAL